MSRTGLEDGMRLLWTGLNAIAMGMLAGTVAAQGQTATAPGSYTIKETNSMLGPTVTMAFYKDGNRAVLDERIAAGDGMPKEMNTRAVFNLQTKQGVSWDLGKTGASCAPATFGGDWGDPFSSSAMMTSDMGKQKPKELGMETYLGLAAKILEFNTTPDGKVKVWIDAKYGLLLKIISTPPGATAKTVLEVTEISLTAPDPAVFVPIAGCPAM